MPVDTLSVFNQSQPFGGVLLPDAPMQIVFDSGSPVSTVFGRIGHIVPLAADYAAFYAPLTGAVPPGGTPGQVLTTLEEGTFGWTSTGVNLVPSVFGRVGNIAAQQSDYAGFYEPLLGKPPVDGYVLASNMDGSRFWVSAPPGGGGGSRWFEGDGPPGDIPGATAGDKYLDRQTGNVWTFA
jgi:hypothetical protein